MSVIIRADKRIPGATFYKSHVFNSGRSVPIYNISTIEALTQMVGYAKYINADYGNVLYRGECNLHNNLLPSIYRFPGHQGKGAMKYLNICLDRALNDTAFTQYAGLPEHSISRQIVEGVFQHYGIPTHYMDVVDNHWSALWFGLYQASIFSGKEVFIEYRKRIIDNLTASMATNNVDDELIHQYLICIAIDSHTSDRGISKGCDTIAIDLRTALPSLFLRPHAQHGWVVKRNTSTCDHDLSSNVVAILRMRIDHVVEWIGGGELMSVNHMFPRPAYDNGYDVMLRRCDLFLDTPFRVLYCV